MHWNPTPKQLSNLQELLDKIPEFEANELLRLNMGMFMEKYDGTPIKLHEYKEGTCGTSCCLIGYAATILNISDFKIALGLEGYKNWSNLSYHLFGIMPDTPLWDFLFLDYWPNDYKHAAHRLSYVIENRNAPDEYIDMLERDYLDEDEIIYQYCKLTHEHLTKENY